MFTTPVQLAQNDKDFRMREYFTTITQQELAPTN